MPAKCNNCGHLQRYHEDEFFGISCMWHHYSWNKGCRCKEFEYPPMPTSLSQEEILRTAVAKFLCVEEKSIEKIEVAENEKGVTIGVIMSATILVTTLSLSDWIRQQFWK